MAAIMVCHTRRGAPVVVAESPCARPSPVSPRRPMRGGRQPPATARATGRHARASHPLRATPPAVVPVVRTRGVPCARPRCRRAGAVAPGPTRHVRGGRSSGSPSSLHVRSRVQHRQRATVRRAAGTRWPRGRCRPGLRRARACGSSDHVEAISLILRERGESYGVPFRAQAPQSRDRGLVMVDPDRCGRPRQRPEEPPVAAAEIRDVVPGCDPAPGHGEVPPRLVTAWRA